MNINCIVSLDTHQPGNVKIQLRLNYVYVVNHVTRKNLYGVPRPARRPSPTRRVSPFYRLSFLKFSETKYLITNYLLVGVTEIL